MIRLLTISAIAISLAGCTVREQQLATAGVAGAIVGSALTAPQPRTIYMEEPRPVYVQQPRYVVSPPPPRRPHCYSVWDRTHRGDMIERRICN
jgi:hypothetical protein